MKIGILTFHRAENFGAVLQCYALQSFLESQGFEVKVIDYRCRAIEQTYYFLNVKSLFSRFNIFASILNYFNQMYQWKDRLHKKRGYEMFRKKFLHLTDPMYEIKKDLGFDVYITGSDQVWNTQLLHGLNKMYFLDFPQSEGVKRISYAVSSEQNAINELSKYESYLRHALNNFTSISVRENAFASELKKYTSKNIHVCLDPTFLITKENYIKLAIKPKYNNYILVYHMAEIPEGSKLAEKIARKNGAKVVEIHARFANRKDKTRHMQNVGPLELLGYIAYANMIITTSFHGLALSLILEKNFYVISKSGNLRLRHILGELGLSNRIIVPENDVFTDDINYKSVSEKIRVLSEDSKKFLINALNN